MQRFYIPLLISRHYEELESFLQVLLLPCVHLSSPQAPASAGRAYHLRASCRILRHLDVLLLSVVLPFIGANNYSQSQAALHHCFSTTTNSASTGASAAAVAATTVVLAALAVAVAAYRGFLCLTAAGDRIGDLRVADGILTVSHHNLKERV
ncbi:hypothetical protein E2C01_034888 [Portunus trituberculatus]|uniref:Uncharacterized protein n=1 Tax=Portunus trituberculatus TaxID=210409 RepID=A0A5B7F1R3_PORTR|nr:hypothetical protein [Portunus trituberculatus]